jgi:hypothetical protein
VVVVDGVPETPDAVEVVVEPAVPGRVEVVDTGDVVVVGDACSGADVLVVELLGRPSDFGAVVGVGAVVDVVEVGVVVEVVVGCGDRVPTGIPPELKQAPPAVQLMPPELGG